MAQLGCIRSPCQFVLIDTYPTRAEQFSQPVSDSPLASLCVNASGPKGEETRGKGRQEVTRSYFFDFKCM
jgi:hypothetical protein